MNFLKRYLENTNAFSAHKFKIRDGNWRSHWQTSLNENNYFIAKIEKEMQAIITHTYLPSCVNR